MHAYQDQILKTDMTEFYYNKRKYSCCLVKVDSLQELRIRNDQGEVLAIKQGKKIGLQGKRRENSKQVDVSQPYLYNLIKAAINALEIAEKNQLILEKDQTIDRKSEQINILTQQLYIIKSTQILSVEQSQQFSNLQDTLKELETLAEMQKHRISELEDELSQLPQIVPLEKIEKQVRTKLGESIWNCLHPASKRELCDAYREYQLIKSEEFTGQADYSKAGLGLGVVAEREIVIPFFQSLYQFLSTYNHLADFSTGNTFEIGAVVVKANGKYTLGDLPALISNEWDTFIDNVLEQEEHLPQNKLYRTVFCSAQVTSDHRQIVSQFLRQWEHPLSQWLAQGQLAASTIDQIRKLRNRSPHPAPMYRWQFKVLWSLLVGIKSNPGILQAIYSSVNNNKNNSFRAREGVAAFNSSPSYSNAGSLSY